MSFGRRLLAIAFHKSARMLRQAQPKVTVTITCNGLPAFIGWHGEVPFDG